jgi:class 3 adenylate cyclase
LAKLITFFEQRCHEIAYDHQARLVKLIGDEVMFTSVESVDTVGVASDLVAAFADDGVHGRGGASRGDLVSIHGDYFGPVVNRAARLVEHAVPGEVLVDEATADSPGVTATPAGRRMLRGFDDPVPVFALAD